MIQLQHFGDEYQELFMQFFQSRSLCNNSFDFFALRKPDAYFGVPNYFESIN